MSYNLSKKTDTPYLKSGVGNNTIKLYKWNYQSLI